MGMLYLQVQYAHFFMLKHEKTSVSKSILSDTVCSGAITSPKAAQIVVAVRQRKESADSQRRAKRI